MGGEGEFLVLGLGCLETECRHLVSNPVRQECTTLRKKVVKSAKRLSGGVIGTNIFGVLGAITSFPLKA